MAEQQVAEQQVARKTARYGWTFGVVLIAGLLYGAGILLWITATSERTDPVTGTWFSYEWSKFLWWPTWLVAAIVALAIVVSVWVFVGVMIVKAKAKIEALAAEKVVISTNSWHFRLQNWLGNDPANIRGGCEYWPKLLHGLLFLFPGRGLLRGIVEPAAYCIYMALIVPIVLVLGWLQGARPKFFLSMDVQSPSFHADRQRLGPIVLLCMFVAGIISFLQLTGWGQVAWDTASSPSWTPSWGREGLYAAWVFGVIGMIIAVVIIGYLVAQAIQSLRPFASYVSALIVGRCSIHEYVD